MLEYPHIHARTMFNLDQKYESYVRNGDKKLRIDGEEHRVRGYGYTDNGKDIDGYYMSVSYTHLPLPPIYSV